MVSLDLKSNNIMITLWGKYVVSAEVDMLELANDFGYRLLLARRQGKPCRVVGGD